MMYAVMSAIQPGLPRSKFDHARRQCTQRGARVKAPRNRDMRRRAGRNHRMAMGSPQACRVRVPGCVAASDSSRKRPP